MTPEMTQGTQKKWTIGNYDTLTHDNNGHTQDCYNTNTTYQFC